MNCPFCSEIASGLPPDREGVDVVSREILRTEHFVVLADISPLIVGHVLVLPRSHDLSFGAVASTHLAEFRELSTGLRQTLATTFSEPVLMEHGTDSRSAGGGCVAHAHMHFVPGPV